MLFALLIVRFHRIGGHVLHGVLLHVEEGVRVDRIILLGLIIILFIERLLLNHLHVYLSLLRRQRTLVFAASTYFKNLQVRDVTFPNAIDHVRMLVEVLHLKLRRPLHLLVALQRQQRVRARLVLWPDAVDVDLVRQLREPNVLVLRVLPQQVLQVVHLREVVVHELRKVFCILGDARVVEEVD